MFLQKQTNIEYKNFFGKIWKGKLLNVSIMTLSSNDGKSVAKITLYEYRFAYVFTEENNDPFKKPIKWSIGVWNMISKMG